MEEILRRIRTDLRLAMDGLVSASMRDKGADYKLNFGVNVPKLRELAKKYRPNAELADILWKNDVRELKILGTMLYPSEELTNEKANEWIRSVPNQEIREQLCVNLLQKIHFAGSLVTENIDNADESVRITAYWLYVRLCISRSVLIPEIDPELVAEQALRDVFAENYFLRTSALNALKFAGRNSLRVAEFVLEMVQKADVLDEAWKNEVMESLKFEYENYGR